MIQKIKVSEIRPNPNNPRVIKDDKFKKLLKSITDFPQMLELRPIVVNDDMIVLGGNMRLKALEHLGIEETYIIKAKDLTDKQEQEFIIKDNVGYGEWDWDQLANEWDVEDLDEWGLDILGIDDRIDGMNDGEEIEFDVIAICCDFSEDSFENIADQYGIELDPEMDEDYQKQQVIEHLEYEGAYVGDSINGIVYRQF